MVEHNSISRCALSNLSRRERRIAAHFADGMSYKEVANLLFISPGTVRTHITTIYRKLDVSNKTMLAKIMTSESSQNIANTANGNLLETAHAGQVGSMSTEIRCSETRALQLVDSESLPNDDNINVLFYKMNEMLLRLSRVVKQQHEISEQLASSETRYHALADTCDNFVARMTADHRLTFVNDSYCCYYGHRREHLLGRPFNELTLTTPEDRKRDAAHLNALTPEHRGASILLQRQLPGGVTRYVQWIDTALFDPNGRLVEVQSVGRDVTD